MDHVKNYFAKMTAYKIERDPTLAENMTYDNNGILSLIKINQLLKVSFLVGQIFNISLMSSLVWLIVVNIINDDSPQFQS